ncbi:MAG TPA: ABC transporter ATP-binding protein [Chitinophagaceae bacterium]|nr:ABC transporter ATP-binding protein [Chitinophagales bacterium]HPG10676.1 ABC transporter ATP-binding protein [Chitinophagaceae bacterium]HRX94443.1 ABC transporter ATP-binding protein [Chitinophagaceae bacterium]
MPVIEVKQLKKTYNETMVPVHALNGVDLTFEKGEFTAIVGPSGCGKTTLLNMMGGLDRPTSGIVTIENDDITNMKAGELVDFRLNNIGFIFQSYNLIPVLTVKENIEFIMELQHRNRKEMEDRVRYLLEVMGLSDKINVRPRYLSGGQQQRVAVARALASKPKFILADEPTANLDSKSTDILLDLMAELNQKENVTFVFSTHDQRVMDKARRIITLEDGKVISDIKQVKSNEARHS